MLRLPVYKYTRQRFTFLNKFFITFVNHIATIMNERLQQFLSAENITQAEFADTIKVARASVSHIIAGRNKPGYDFIAGILRHYPNLNIEWLISGKGKMYKSDIIPVPSDENTLFSRLAVTTENDPRIPADAPVPETQNQAPAQPQICYIEKEPPKQRKAVKVMIFFDDGTFQEFPTE